LLSPTWRQTLKGAYLKALIAVWLIQAASVDGPVYYNAIHFASFILHSSVCEHKFEVLSPPWPCLQAVDSSSSSTAAYVYKDPGACVSLGAGQIHFKVPLSSADGSARALGLRWREEAMLLSQLLLAVFEPPRESG
jgi:hypothetical protein